MLEKEWLEVGIRDLTPGRRGPARSLMLGLHALPVDFLQGCGEVAWDIPRGWLTSKPPKVRYVLVPSTIWALFLSYSTLGKKSIRKSGIGRTWGWVGK